MARASVDFSHPWNPATPLPQFITHDYVDPANLVAISKYRSDAGHTFSDNYEPFDRSLKNYFEARKVYLNTNQSLPLFAPAAGTITSVGPEQQVLSNGDIRGSQITLNPDGYPAFEIRLFHVNLASNLAVGSHVNPGDPLGYADIRESIDFDFAVGAAWNATPLYGQIGLPLGPAPGYRLLSSFDLMTDATFAHWAKYGLTDRSQLIVSLAYRAAHPGTFPGQDIYNFDPNEFAILQTTPDIATQPASQVLNPSSSGSFSVFASAQGAPLTYQWYLNGAVVSDGAGFSGSTSSALNFYAITQAQAGSYTVTVTDAYGSTTSNPATLTVLATPVPLPVIMTQPLTQTVNSNTNVTLSVTASGFGLLYQWIFNNGYLFGATSSTLVLNAVGIRQAGTYVVNITNPAGSVASSPAVLTVTELPPIITAQPLSQTVGPNFSVTFSVTASGADLSYLWYFKGTPIGTGAALTLFDVNSAQAGSYTVVVSNPAGSVTSNAATLTISSPVTSGGGGSGGGGGGGAPSLWFSGALALLAGLRRLRRRKAVTTA